MKLKYSTRLVIILKNVVIKIPVSRRGFLQGRNEKKIWVKYNLIAPLAELKWEYIGIVCQKRYSQADVISTASVNQIKEIIPEFAFTGCDLHNFKNWGVERNKSILLDYGINKHISTLYKEDEEMGFVEKAFTRIGAL